MFFVLKNIEGKIPQQERIVEQLLEHQDKLEYQRDVRKERHDIA